MAKSASGLRVEQGERALGEQAFRRDIHQIEPPGRASAAPPRAASPADSVELRNAARTPSCRKRAHLILHQRDERRHHHPDAGAQHGGDLIAERLAAAGGHQHKGVAPRRHLRDDLFLVTAKGVEAENRAQQLACARGNIVLWFEYLAWA